MRTINDYKATLIPNYASGSINEKKEKIKPSIKSHGVHKPFVSDFGRNETNCMFCGDVIPEGRIVCWNCEMTKTRKGD